MSTIDQLLDQFKVCPKEQITFYKNAGQKMIGCLPVYCPEELVYAAGMVPIGIWGAEMEVSKAKSYFPAFICSIAQTSLEMGLKGDLDDLSAVMIPILCDSLKALGQNWKMGVKNIEFIPVTHPQNRKIEAGVQFLKNEYMRIKTRLEEISGQVITEEKLQQAIKVYNDHHAIMREFSEVAAQYPHLISPIQRNQVIKSSYFMKKDEHTEKVRALIEACKKEDTKEWTGKKVIVTGIIADSPHILEIFKENHLAIVDDEVAHESRQFRTDIPEGKDSMEALAKQFSNREGCSVIYDPKKLRGKIILDKVKEKGADGIVVLMTKFCDPEEFDYPIMKEEFEKAGVPYVTIEVDQQMRNYEQARTAIQTFVDVLE